MGHGCVRERCEPDCLSASSRNNEALAWVWGALDRPPMHHELCVATGARVRTLGVHWMRTREVVIDADETSVLNGMTVTNPLRTAIDLLRFSESFEAAERGLIGRLMGIFGFDETDCVVEIESRRNLPAKRRALDRTAGLRS